MILDVYLLIDTTLSRLDDCSASDDAVGDYCLNLIFRLNSFNTVSVNCYLQLVILHYSEHNHVCWFASTAN